MNSRGFSQNPALRTIFTADPSAHVWDDGRIYIYASRDMDPPRGCDLMDHYHVFSSCNMTDWRDDGEILCSDDVSWGRAEGGFMWAPDCAYKNGTYYFYYPHPSGSDWNATWKIGVATSSHPAKDFTDKGHIEGMGGFAMIDPCVFGDDDGRFYLYYGGGSKCQGSELGEDMMSLKNGLIDMTGIEDYHEGPWVFKREGIYYLTYADNSHGQNKMRYATSKSPLGPWDYKGIFLEPTGCDTTHGSVVEYKGQWYLFYHNQAISNHGCNRSVCIDRLYFNDDGTIKTVVQSTQGVPAVGEAENLSEQVYQAKDLKIGGGASLMDGFIGGLDGEGSYISLSLPDIIGRVQLSICYANADRLSKLTLWVNGIKDTPLNFTSTGGWDVYGGKAVYTVKLSSGANELRLCGGDGRINVKTVSIAVLD
ncbi:MAG: family 43 glycosylhydrolase [Eubacteriales bacterium]